MKFIAYFNVYKYNDVARSMLLKLKQVFIKFIRYANVKTTAAIACYD